MRGVVFTSRKKDNIIFDFKPRKKSFLSDKSVKELMLDFLEFANNGEFYEVSRFYININERDNSKSLKALEHYLIDHPDFTLDKILQKSTSIAMKPENAKTHKWLFDYDSDEGIRNFKYDLLKAGLKEDEIRIYKTVNHYSVVVDHGFDCRKLLTEYPCCELKRDGMLCVRWAEHNPTNELNVTCDEIKLMSDDDEIK